MNPGDVLDNRYQITERLGAGGMGEVYKATHLHLGATRVIKVVHPQISGNTDAQDRFLREARAATRVHHQNVATLHDFSTLADGSHYMVWEYIDGENLAQKLRIRGTLPPKIAVEYIVQTLHGLDAIHRAGIIHRDISPENIMITREDDSVKIIDLGVAKVEDSEVSQTRTGIFVGKLRYAAPEQLGFIPEGEKVDGRVDIYAVAMVLVELLTGRPPYEAKSPHEYFILHASQAPPKAVELPDDLPGSAALLPVLNRALARNRNERYTTAREFSYALEDIQRNLPNPRDMATMALPYDGDATMRVTPRTNPDTLHRNTVITSAKTAALTPPPPPPPSAAPPPPPPEAAPQAAATILTPLPEAPFAQPQFVQPPITAAPKQGSFAPLIIVGVILLLLAAGAAAIVFRMKPWERFTRKTDDTTTTATTATTAAATTSTQVATPAATSVDVTTTAPAATTTEPAIPTATVVETTQTVAPTKPPVVNVPPAKPPAKPPVVAQNPPADSGDDNEGDAEPSDDDDSSSAVDGFAPGATYVDGGDDGQNERALAALRRELRGTKRIGVRGGSMTLDLSRALREEFPNLEFVAYAPVIIRFNGTLERRGMGRKRRGAVATVSKNGRVIFRYEMPNETYRVGATPVEAFVRVVADAMNE